MDLKPVVSEATRLHADYLGRLHSSLSDFINLHDLVATVASFLPPSNILYWFEAELFYLSSGHRCYDMLNALKENRHTQPLIPAFNAYAERCWTQHWANEGPISSWFYGYSCEKYFRWSVSFCNRGICYAGSMCYCDDALTSDVLRERIRIREST